MSSAFLKEHVLRRCLEKCLCFVTDHNRGFIRPSYTQYTTVIAVKRHQYRLVSKQKKYVLSDSMDKVTSLVRGTHKCVQVHAGWEYFEKWKWFFHFNERNLPSLAVLATFACYSLLVLHCIMHRVNPPRHPLRPSRHLTEAPKEHFWLSTFEFSIGINVACVRPNQNTGVMWQCTQWSHGWHDRMWDAQPGGNMQYVSGYWISVVWTYILCWRLARLNVWDTALHVPNF